MTEDPLLTQARSAALTVDAAELAAAVAALDGHAHPAARLWSAICRLLDETGERTIGQAELHARVDEVLALAEGRADPARAAAHAASAFRLIRGDALERSLAELARAIVLLEQDAAGADAAVACELVAYTYTIAAPTWDGMSWTERALAAAQRGAPPELVEMVRSRFALRLLGIAEDLAAIGETEQARELGRRALALYDEIWEHSAPEHRSAELAVNLAFTNLLLEQPEPVGELLAPLMDYPDPWLQALANLGTGQAAAMIGDDERALVHLTRAADHLRENRERWHLTFTLQGMLAPLARLGRHEEQVRVAEEAVIVARRISHDHQLRFAVAVRSRVRELAAEERARVADAAATTDQVTTLSNRRGFDRRVGALLADAGRAAVFAVIDVDHFKQVNDQYGHLVGDEVLRHVAIALRECVRGSDLLARWAGDEFAAVLLDAGLVEAAAVLERFRARVEAHNWEALHRGLRVTVTVGAVPRHRDESPGETFGLADQALFEAKRAGRNRVVVDSRRDVVPLP